MRRDVTAEADRLFEAVSPITIAAHELKTPLSLIRQLSLELATGETTMAEQRRIIEQVTLVSEKALRLTNDLTKSNSQIELDLNPVNPLDVSYDVRDELERMYAAHNRTLKVKRVRNVPPIVANRELLRRILMNFADNALYYANADGAVELQAQLIRERAIVRMSVRDYGPHMPRKAWKKLVAGLHNRQPVHQRPQSSGLGLYISDTFAKRMNGTIGAIRHSDGASFYVELPVSEQMALL